MCFGVNVHICLFFILWNKHNWEKGKFILTKNNIPSNDEKNEQIKINKQDLDVQNNSNINQNKEKVIKMVTNDKIS
jgi:hypothetical protein